MFFQCDSDCAQQRNRRCHWRHANGHHSSWEEWSKIPLASFKTASLGQQCWRTFRWVKSCVCVCVSLLHWFSMLLHSLFPAVEAAVYEEVQQAPVRKLKIKNQEADVTGYIFFFLYLCFCFALFSHYYKDIWSLYSFFCREMVVDYSFVSPVSMNCWLMSADSALQRPLFQFVITQL